MWFVDSFFFGMLVTGVVIGLLLFFDKPGGRGLR